MIPLAKLFKIKIALMAALSAATGYLLTGQPAGWDLLLPTLATLVLACGSAALNECQERELDARMERTRNRPIPSGWISPRTAAWVAAGLILAGLSSLAIGAGWLTAALGALAVIWYNAIYTPLKRRTPFAAVIGAPVGAIPPAVGWVAGGGDLRSPAILGLMAFLFLWQVPHFWLLLLARREEYEQAGLPGPTSLFGPAQLRRITFAWTMAMAVVSLGFPVFGIARHPLAFALILLITLHQAIRATVLLRAESEARPVLVSLFNRLNAHTLLVLLVIALSSGFSNWTT